MRILWFILLVSTVGLGRCKSPKDGLGNPETGAQADPQNGKVLAQQAVPNSPKPVQGHLPQNGQPPSTQDPTTPLTKGVNVNLNSLDGTVLKVGYSTDRLLLLHTITPNDGHRLTEVTYLGASIWKGGQDEHAKTILVYYDGDFPVSLSVNIGHDSDLWKHHVKKGNKWVKVEEKGYKEALTNLRKLASLPKLATARLDVSSLDDNLLTTTDLHDGDVPIKAVTVKSGYKLARVFDLNIPIWKPKDERELCQRLWLYYDGERPVSLVLSSLTADLETPLKYYVKNGRRWTEVTKADFDEALKGLKISPVLLDLSSPDPSKIDVHEGVDSGISYKNYSVKNGYHITSVAESGVTVFGAVNEEEKYTSAEYYSRGGVTLLGLGINDGHSTRPKCFEKNGSTWSEINDDAFFDRYGSMLGESGDNERDTWNESDDESPEDDGSTETPKVLTSSSPEPATPVKKDDVKPPPVTSQGLPQGQLPLPPAFGTLAPGVRSGGFKGEPREKPDDGTKPPTATSYGEKPTSPVTQPTLKQQQPTKPQVPVPQAKAPGPQVQQPANPPQGVQAVNKQKQPQPTSPTTTPQNAQGEGANKPTGQQPTTQAPQGQPANQQGGSQQTPKAAPNAAPKNATVPAPQGQQGATQKPVTQAAPQVQASQPTPQKPSTPVTNQGNKQQLPPQGTPQPGNLQGTKNGSTPTPGPAAQATPQVGAGQPATPTTLQTGAHSSPHAQPSTQPVAVTPQQTAQKSTVGATPDKLVQPTQVTSQQPETQLVTQSAKDVKLDVSSVDGGVFGVSESKPGQITKKTLTPKDGYRLTEVSEGSATIWKGGQNEHANSVLLYYTGNSSSLATITYTKDAGEMGSRYYIRQNDGAWKLAEKQEYDAKLNEIKGGNTGNTATPPDNVKQIAVNSPTHPEETKHAAGTLQVSSQEANTQTASPDLTSKVDGSLFTVEEGKEDGVPTLKLTVKTGVTAKKVTFDGKDLWSGGTKNQCTSATIYLKGEEPHVVLVQYKDGSKDKTVHLHNKGDKWEDKKKDFDEKLKALKDTAPRILDLANPESSICKSFDVNIQGAPAKVYAVFSGIDVTKIVHSGKTVWTSQGTESCFYCASFLKESNPAMTAIRIKGQELSQSFCELKGDKWEASVNENDKKIDELKAHKAALTKFILEISTTSDTDKCKVISENKNGMTARVYAPKNGHHIEEVKDGQASVWKAEGGQLCYLCDYYAKGDFTLMRLHLENNYQLSLSSYRKEGTQDWKTITGKELNTELLKWSTEGSSKAKK